ncbi:hypothetical protein C8J56DRAFT_1059774 [Mycena floridula]|nr:hypothetical protein C8J56DRAFT_1059774 [Mycena floridula]
MVRPRLYKSTKERKEAHNQASIRYYARNHDRISAELRAQRLKQKHKREKAEKRQRDKRARKTENVLEAVIEAHKPDKISQWMRLAAALPRQIHRAMTPNPDSHMNRLLDDLSKPQIDTVGVERTLKRLGELRTKANSFWSPIVALEGTVDSPAFKRYLGFQGQVVKAIAWPHVRGFQEKPWAKAYCRWFVYSKDPSLGTGPLVYLDHSPSFAALNCEDENTVCDLYAATYIQGILFGSYQQTMQAIYDDFLFRYPQYRLGPLFGIDIMLVSNETMIRRGQHIDFLADYLWHYCNNVEPGFRAAGLVRLMHQWHRDYPGAFSIWIDGQAHISPQEEEAWRLSLFMQRWYLDYPGALGRWIDGNSDITRQAEEAWDEAHTMTIRLMRMGLGIDLERNQCGFRRKFQTELQCLGSHQPQIQYTTTTLHSSQRYPRDKSHSTDKELYHRFLQERVIGYINAKSQGIKELQSFLDRTDLHWALCFDAPKGQSASEAARWRQLYIRDGLETIAQRRLFFRRKAKEVNGGKSPSPRKAFKPRPAYKIYTTAHPTPSPVRWLRIRAGISPVLRTPSKASSPSWSSSPVKQSLTEFSSSPLRENSSSAGSLPSSPVAGSSSPSKSAFSSPLSCSSPCPLLTSPKYPVIFPPIDRSVLPQTPSRLPRRADKK